MLGKSAIGVGFVVGTFHVGRRKLGEFLLNFLCFGSAQGRIVIGWHGVPQISIFAFCSPTRFFQRYRTQAHCVRAMNWR
jgi:hypothetical protein